MTFRLMQQFDPNDILGNWFAYKAMIAVNKRGGHSKVDVYLYTLTTSLFLM